MLVVPNPTRTALHSEKIPDGPLSDRQRSIADAVRFCNNLSDFVAVEKEAVTSVTVARIRHGATISDAERSVREGIARARAELDRIERHLKCYGGSAFIPKTQGIPAREIAGETRHEIVTNAMKWATKRGAVLIKAGDSLLSVNESGAYEIVKP